MDFLSAPDRLPKLQRQKLNVGEFLLALRLRDICRLSDRGRRRGEIFLFNQPGHQKEGGEVFTQSRVSIMPHAFTGGKRKLSGIRWNVTCGKGKDKKVSYFHLLAPPGWLLENGVKWIEEFRSSFPLFIWHEKRTLF